MDEQQINSLLTDLKTKRKPFINPIIKQEPQQSIPDDFDTVDTKPMLLPDITKFQTVYDSDKQKFFNTNAQKPEEILYHAATIDNPKKKDNFFWLVDLGVSKTDIVKKAFDFVSNFNPVAKLVNEINKTEKGNEAIRGFAGTSVDLASGLFRGLISAVGGAVKAEQWALTNWSDKEYTDKQLEKITAKTDELNKLLRDKTEKFMKYTGIEKTDKDGFVYDLAGGGASLLFAIGLTVVTKSPAAASYAFGQYQYQSLYEESIDKGYSPMQARKIGFIGGAFETGLEFVGLHLLFRSLERNKGFKRIVGSFLSEFFQEGGQQTAEEIIAKIYKLREQTTWQTVKNIAMAALIGGIWGGSAGVISNIATSATKELVEQGIEQKQAEQLTSAAIKAGLSDDTINIVEKGIKDEQSPVTYKNADPRETYKEFGNTVKKALEPQQQRGIEIEFLQAKQNYKDYLLRTQAAKTEEEAEAAAATIDSLARTAFEQEDIKPADYYKRFHINTISDNIEDNERNIDDTNITMDDDFNPLEFDPEEQARYEKEKEDYENWLAKEQAENGIKKDFKTYKKLLSDMGIGAIRKPKPGDTRYTEYKELSPRIKNAFFVDSNIAMTWDEAEQLLQEHNGDTADIFEYFRDVDLNIPVGQNTYFQAAYHGTPHKFDNFSLEKIGTGEGAQVHGWGLYFAAIKDVSEQYRQVLLDRKTTKLIIKEKGKEVNEDIKNAIDNFVDRDAVYAAAEGNQEAVKKAIRNSIKELESPTHRAYDKKIMKILQEQVTKIKNNPKISIAQFIKEAPAEYSYRFKRIVMIAKDVAKDEKRKANIDDIKNVIQQDLDNYYIRVENEEKQALQILKNIDLDNFTVEANKGQLFKVDIPEEKELLDEQKRFDKQPEQVKTSLKELFLSKDFYNEFFGFIQNYTDSQYQKLLKKYFDVTVTNFNAEEKQKVLKEIKDFRQQHYYMFEDNDIDFVALIDTIEEIVKGNTTETGKYIYSILSRIHTDSDKGASLMLSKYGIKGITYDGRQDGRAYVIFDDKAVKVLEKYYQANVLTDKEKEIGRRFNNFLNKETVEIQPHESLTKKEAEQVFRNNKTVEHNELGTTNFSIETVNKILRHKGFDTSTIIKLLSELYKNSVLIDSPTEKQYTGNKQHKKHTNIAFWHNTLNKFKIQNNKGGYDEYFVRFTVTEQYAGKKKPKGSIGEKTLHSTNISEIEIQKKDGNVANTSNYLGATLPSDDIVADYIKIVKKFNRLNQDNQNPRGATTVYDRQYYIDLFSNADKTTLLHETAHIYLSEISRFAAAKNATKKALDTKTKLDSWLGKPDENGNYSKEQQEKFATSFESYLADGRAPTAKMKTVFEKFKVWISQRYDSVKDYLPKINDEAKAFFDSILSKSYNVPDSNIYDGKVEAIKQVIENAKQGKVSEVDGITIDKVYDLLNLAYMRKPNKPSKNLKQLLNDKNIYDFDELNKAGADKVLKILKDGGYVKDDTTAEKAVEIAKAALDGKTIYRLADGWRIKGDIDFRKNLRTLEKVIDFNEIDSVLEKILELQQAGYRQVEQQDVKEMEDYSRKLFSADVEQAKGYVAEIIEKLHRKSFIDKAAKEQMMTDLNFSSTLEEIQESVLAVIEDLKSEIELVKESLKQPHKPRVIKDKTVLPGEKATEEEKEQYKKYMKVRINRLLKQVLPGKKGNNKVSKFGDKRVQDFFDDLVKINKMTIEQAERAMMDRFVKDNEWIMKDEKGEGFDNFAKIKNMFLGYKAKKITSNSCELLKELYDSLNRINIFGRNEKQINEFLLKQEQSDNIDELLNNIEKNKSTSKISNVFKKFYNYSLANWNSCINSIAGQQQAEKDTLELLEKKVFTQAKSVTDRIIKRSCDVLGFKRTSQFDTKINEYLKEKYEFIQTYINHKGNETQEKQTLNKMQLICCYIWAKNEKLKERIIRAYGNIQFNEMMAKLDKADMLWGDILQEETASMYDEVNAVYVRLYGLDMGQAQNYFPSNVERIQGVMDLFKDFIINTTNPGFIKGRVDSFLILMKFDNPVKIAFNHIAKATRYSVMQEKLAGIYKKYLNTSVEKALNRIYGDDKIFNYIKKMLDNIRFTNFTKQVDVVNSMFDHFSNTYVLTRIAAKPSIMIKQLLSFTNYMEDVDSSLWIKHFTKMITNPKELKKVKEFMYKHSPYLKARYESGAQNEALEKAMEGQAQTILKIKTFKGFLSLMTRVGDITAIIYGGYPMVQAQLEKGVDIKTAFENFEKATLRSQQANFASTLSNWQNYFKNDPMLRAIFAFGNTPAQYTRKLVDVCYKMAHGDEEFWNGKGFKTLVLYGIEQSFVYTSFTSLALINGLVNGDWDDFKDDVWLSLFQVSNFLGVPWFGQLYNFLVSMLVTGDFVQEKRVPILDDFTSFLRAAKKTYNEGVSDLDFEDWINTTDKLASIATGIPIKTLYNTWISSWIDILNGDYGKGLTKLYGATESRANKIFD